MCFKFKLLQITRGWLSLVGMERRQREAVMTAPGRVPGALLCWRVTPPGALPPPPPPHLSDSSHRPSSVDINWHSPFYPSCTETDICSLAFRDFRRQGDIWPPSWLTSVLHRSILRGQWVLETHSSLTQGHFCPPSLLNNGVPGRGALFHCPCMPCPSSDRKSQDGQ